MPESPSNGPTGSPGGAPARPNAIRREIEDALDAARHDDRRLRAEVLALTTSHSQASTCLSVATEEAGEAAGLAKRALSQAEESARAGQRADAAKLTSAAEVFAMRVRDARRQVASLEQELVALDEQRRRAHEARRENLAGLQALIDARLPLLRGRKAGRVQHAVESVMGEISVPTGSLIAEAAQAARAVDQSADEAAAVVTDDDLEREVDFEGTEAILDELRGELGLPGGAAAAAPAPPPAGQAKGNGSRGKGEGSRGEGEGSRGAGSPGRGEGSRGRGNGSRGKGEGSRGKGGGSRAKGGGSRARGGGARGDGPQAEGATGGRTGGEQARRSRPVPSTRR